MISSLQPQRPKLPQQHTHPSSGPYQQSRASTTTTSPSPSPSLIYQPPTPTQAPQSPLSHPPRNQLEAMPPSSSAAQRSQMNNTSSPLYSAATRHPVFFTSSLFKPPFPLPPVASQAGWSPVASGYVFEQGSGRRIGAERTKL